MKSILFVEDNLGLIEELIELLLRIVPADGLLLQFATSAESAMECLEGREQGFDAVVLDVMLPEIHGVPSNYEGIYFGAWLLGKTNRPDLLTDFRRPQWLESKKDLRLIFLTSVDDRPVMERFDSLTDHYFDDRQVRLLKRLGLDVDKQVDEIIDILALLDNP